MIELQAFCRKDDERTFLREPWSFGKWTYASNSVIIIRVSRIAAIPENTDALNDKAAGYFEHWSGDSAPLPQLELPTEGDECYECAGSGREHYDCPTCECKCAICDGTGVADPCRQVSVGLSGAIFSGEYIKLIATLPDVRVCSQLAADKPMWFLFDGGEGVIMPRVDKRAQHLTPKP